MRDATTRRLGLERPRWSQPECSSSEIASNIQEHLDLIRASTTLPVAVGFGISTPEQAAAVARMADGVVVGSAIVNTIAEHAGSDQLAEKLDSMVRPMVEATHAARR